MRLIILALFVISGLASHAFALPPPLETYGIYCTPHSLGSFSVRVLRYEGPHGTAPASRVAWFRILNDVSQAALIGAGRPGYLPHVFAVTTTGHVVVHRVSDQQDFSLPIRARVVAEAGPLRAVVSDQFNFLFTVTVSDSTPGQPGIVPGSPWLNPTTYGVIKAMQILDSDRIVVATNSHLIVARTPNGDFTRPVIEKELRIRGAIRAPYTLLDLHAFVARGNWIYASVTASDPMGSPDLRAVVQIKLSDSSDPFKWLKVTAFDTELLDVDSSGKLWLRIAADYFSLDDSSGIPTWVEESKNAFRWHLPASGTRTPTFRRLDYPRTIIGLPRYRSQTRSTMAPAERGTHSEHREAAIAARAEARTHQSEPEPALDVAWFRAALYRHLSTTRDWYLGTQVDPDRPMIGAHLLEVLNVPPERHFLEGGLVHRHLDPAQMLEYMRMISVIHSAIEAHPEVFAQRLVWTLAPREHAEGQLENLPRVAMGLGWSEAAGVITFSELVDLILGNGHCSDSMRFKR